MGTTESVAVALAAIGLAGRLAHLLIRLRARILVERARQESALATAAAIPPDSAVLVQQPDGTITVVVRGSSMAFLPSMIGRPR